MGRKAPKGLQKHVLKKKLRAAGIKVDGIDLEAELDDTLTMPENISNLEQKYGALERTGREYKTKSDRFVQERKKAAKREARQHHSTRPKYNRYVDEVRQAQTVFRDPTERQMEKWKEKPHKYDIQGVDTKKAEEERTQATLPFHRKKDKTNHGLELIKMAQKHRKKDPEGYPGMNLKRKQSSLDISKSKAQRGKTKKAVSKSVKDWKNFRDKRSKADVEKNLKGTTTARSKQKGLREGGYVSQNKETNFRDYDLDTSFSKSKASKYRGNFY